MKIIRLLVTICYLLYPHTECLSQAGSLDVSFGTNGLVATGDPLTLVLSPPGNYIGLQSSGKIIATGYTSNSTLDFAMVRFHINGIIDSSFGSNGKVQTAIGSQADVANTIAIYPDDKILIGGSVRDGSVSNIGLVRYLANGKIDSSFGTNGKVVTNLGYSSQNVGYTLIQPDGKIVIGGSVNSFPSANFLLVRYNQNGTLDSTLAGVGFTVTDLGRNDVMLAMALQPDGKLIAAGNSNSISVENFALVRYKTNGTLDSTFGIAGKLVSTFGFQSNYVFTVAIQPDHKIVVGGATGPNQNDFSFALQRITPNGTPDFNFGINGVQITDISSGADRIHTLVIQSDGKILAGGIGGGFALARYDSSGYLDPAFGTSGYITTVFPNSTSSGAYSMALQLGKIILGGITSNRFSMARYNNDLSTVPLNIVSFNAYSVGNRNKLIWTAENESADEYFEVEKSKEGDNWVKVNTINCIENSGIRNSYTVYDNTPFTDLTYYRIKQIYNDALFKYSPIQTVKLNNNISLNTSLYPNPCVNTLEISFYLDQRRPVTIRILNSIGLVMLKKNEAGMAGYNKLKITLLSFSSGVYILEMSRSSQHDSLKFIVQ